MMNCPDKIKLMITELSIEKCQSNYEFWAKEFKLDEIKEEQIADDLKISNLVLPCHTVAYEKINEIFFPLQMIL